MRKVAVNKAEADAKPAKSPKKPRRKAKSTEFNHAPSKRELETFERRNEVLDLRESGMSMRNIAKTLTERGFKRCSPTTIYHDLCAVLEDLYKNQRMKTRHHVVLELNKIDRAETAVFPKLFLHKDPDSVNKLTASLERIWKRRDALLGLHKPQKVELSARDALAKLLGRAPEELPDDADLDA